MISRYFENSTTQFNTNSQKIYNAAYHQYLLWKAAVLCNNKVSKDKVAQTFDLECFALHWARVSQSVASLAKSVNLGRFAKGSIEGAYGKRDDRERNILGWWQSGLTFAVVTGADNQQPGPRYPLQLRMIAPRGRKHARGIACTCVINATNVPICIYC